MYALSEWKKEGRALFISSITIAETLAIPGLNDAELQRIRAFLKNFISVSFDDLIAETAARIRREYRLEIPDAGIAATALVRNVQLVTRDRQLRKIKEIVIVEV